MLLAAVVALGLQVQPCTQGKTQAPALCGTYGVYENRAAQSGRIIGLKFIVIKAKHPTDRTIAEIAGGPGESVTTYAEPIADGEFMHQLILLNDSYNIIFMDDRGMGGSNGLQCNLSPENHPELYFRNEFAPELVRACRGRLAAANDLTQYNTNNAVDDLNELRAALGYPKLVLFGGSYGTLFSLVYMRRHPETVESAVLDGANPPGFQPLPGEPMGAQRALDDLVTKCTQDAACAKSFPHFKEQFYALIAQLDHGPVAVQFVAKKGAAPVTVQLSKEVFVDQVRHMLYDPEHASYLPLVLDKYAHGDTKPLATSISETSIGLDEDLAMGAWLSFTCAEGIPFLDQHAVDDAAAHSFAGDLRIEAQRKACAIWDVPAMPTSFNDPVQSDAPTLIISGTDDPATPPKYAVAAAKYLPNARIVLVQGAGHVTETACVDQLTLQFVRANSAEGLDVDKCSAGFTVPKFPTKLPPH